MLRIGQTAVLTLCLLFMAAPIWADDGKLETGTLVVVIAPQVNLQYQDKIVARLTTGTTFRAQRVTEKWIGGYVDRDGRRQPGWVERKHVIPESTGIAYFTAAIKKNAKDHAAYVARAQLLRRRGEYEKAIADCTQAILVNANSDFAYNNRAYSFHLAGQYSQAVADYNEALKLNPKDASSRNDRGFNYALLGNYDKAVADYNAALKQSPDHAGAHNNLAWLRATCPNESFRDGQEAVTHGRRACELSNRRNPDLLDTLAAAYAESGQFKLAVETLDAALKLLPAASRTALEKRRKLYAAGKPYREK